MSRESTGIIVGAAGFAAAALLVLVGAFSKLDTVLIIGVAVATLTAASCLILQFSSPKER